LSRLFRLLGSWDGGIKLWALSPTLKQFSFVCSVPAAGVVNSLQLLAVPNGKLRTDDWQKPSPATDAMDQDDGDASAEQARQPRRAKIPADILLVAAVGREPRLGRWIKVKDGAKNGTLLVHLGKP
jgi:ribosomal RNA-processing protein 9